MPKNEGGKEVVESSPLFSYPNEQQKTKLDYLKGLMINAGYGNELRKYKDGEWVKAACDLGVLRDGFGNRISLPDDASPARVAETITANNASFYVAERETGAFRKYGDDGENGFMSMAYNTPPEISRPNIFLRLLDYLGIDIPSVKEYNKQMQSVKGNPYYNKLNTAASLAASKDFVVKSSKLPMPPEPVPEKKEPAPEKEELEYIPEQEKVQLTDPTPATPEPSDVSSKADAAVSVEESETEIKITMADGSVRVFAKQAPEMKAPSEEEVSAAEQNDIKLAEEASLKEKEAEADALSDIDAKIFELDRKAEQYPALSPIGLEITRAREALEKLKETGSPENAASPSYEKQMNAAVKAAGTLMAVDAMEYYIENGSAAEREKYLNDLEHAVEIADEEEKIFSDEAIKGALGTSPAEKLGAIFASETSLLRFETAVINETQKIEQEAKELEQATAASLKEKEAEADALSDIDLKIFELNEKAKNYPESSPIGIGIIRAKDALEEVKRIGVPEDPTSPSYAKQLDCAANAAKKLFSVDFMEYTIETKPGEEANKYSRGSEESTAIVNEAENFVPDEAIRNALKEKPAEKFNGMLTSENALLRFETDVINEAQKLAKEEELASEKEAAREEPAQEKANIKEEPENAVSDEKKADAKDIELIDKKIYELSRKAKNYPEDSPMGAVIKNAKDALEELKETGLPDDPAAPDHDKRFSAVQKAASGLLFVDQLEGAMKDLPENQREKLISSGEHSADILKELNKLTASAAVERTLYNNPASKMRRLLNEDAALAKFEKAVVKEMKNNPAGNLIPVNAVVHGAVYKEPGKPGWQRMPGAKEEDVKKSLDELSALKPDDRIFKKIAKAESGIPVLRNREAEKSLKDRIDEMRELTEKYPEDSVMNRLGKKATEALSELDKNGLPQAPSSPAYKKQQDSLKKAVAAVCAFEHFSKKVDKLGLDDPKYPDAAGAVEQICDHYAKHELIGAVAGAATAKLVNDLVNNKISDRGLAKSMRKEERERKDAGIPLSAERKGALYRMSSKENWKQVPGATLKEVNDSLLTVMDEKQDMLLASRQKAQENIHFSDATLTFGT